MTRDKKNGREHAVFTLSSSCSDSLPTLSWLSGVSRPVPLSLENLSPKAIRICFTPYALAGGQGGKCPKRVRPSISRTQYPEMSDQKRGPTTESLSVKQLKLYLASHNLGRIFVVRVLELLAARCLQWNGSDGVTE